MCPFKCWCQDRNPNRTEIHSYTYCMWGKFKNPNGWKPGSRDCISCTPLKCESSGCPKHFRQFAFLNLQYITFGLNLFCIAFLYLHFVCIYNFRFFFAFSFCSCFLFAFSRSFFFSLHAAFFQCSKFLRQSHKGPTQVYDLSMASLPALCVVCPTGPEPYGEIVSIVCLTGPKLCGECAWVR